ncbi:GM13616 [Drosophila sechellia]|uniref:GM13616 n=1 Tax=Drosophila sechellia TaxID=7238 RepID=B4IQC0_DROSE|nr:GM13616 [Drosophila sechellia]
MPPSLIAVSEFVEETRSDYSSPTTSTFASRMPDCRHTIGVLEEVSVLSRQLPSHVPCVEAGSPDSQPSV